MNSETGVFLLFLEARLVLVMLAVGWIPAWIASSKGRSFFVWWLYGGALWIVAIIHAFYIDKDENLISRRDAESRRRRQRTAGGPPPRVSIAAICLLVNAGLMFPYVGISDSVEVAWLHHFVYTVMSIAAVLVGNATWRGIYLTAWPAFFMSSIAAIIAARGWDLLLQPDSVLMVLVAPTVLFAIVLKLLISDEADKYFGEEFTRLFRADHDFSSNDGLQ